MTQKEIEDIAKESIIVEEEKSPLWVMRKKVAGRSSSDYELCFGSKIDVSLYRVLNIAMERNLLFGQD